MQEICFLLLYALKHHHIASHISTKPVWPFTHMFKHTLNGIFQEHLFTGSFY